MAILGINISHDASVAVLDKNGKILKAVSEERLSRKKNHSGIPIRAINYIKDFNYDIETVVIGSDSKLSKRKLEVMESQISGLASASEGENWPYVVPGFRSSKTLNVKNGFETLILKHFDFLNAATFKWMNHHDSHLGQSLSVSSNDLTLLMSLDGHGDGESGAIAVSRDYHLKNLSRFKELDSLGDLYSAVTKRYNFKINRHEGKITGLAGFGEYSGGVEVLLKYVNIKAGKPYIHNLSGLKSRIVKNLVPRRFTKKFILDMDSIVQLAENETKNYADLAFAIQFVLEESVLEIARYWKAKTNTERLAVAGGVFSNVKLNQRLAEELNFKSVRVFPNMGDGGISVGGVWAYLEKSGRLEMPVDILQSMYLASNVENLSEIEIAKQFKLSFQAITRKELPVEIASCVNEGKMVGLHFGDMEFGPRALGNRSIVIDPRIKSINEIANKRLKRTEFMPFAPVVLAEFSRKYFELDKIPDLMPFLFMTMTCSVRQEHRSLIPAVVHIDGTARPQIIYKESNLLYWEVLEQFRILSGLPILVNTSFNVHEEPINFTLSDSLLALNQDAVDIVFTQSGKFFRE